MAINSATAYINRELSWLDFNERVLQEADDESTPVLERIKFLGIFSNNQDEFFRVRVATLKRIIKYPRNYLKEYQLHSNPKDILQDIQDRVQEQQRRFLNIYRKIVKQLNNENVFIINEKEVKSKIHQQFIQDFFRRKLRTHVFPIMLKHYNANCVLRDKSIYLAIRLMKKHNPKAIDYALIEVPTDQMSRFLVLPEIEEKKYIMIIDDVIRYNLSEIFSMFDYDEFDAYNIKFTRDAELDIDNDIAKSFMALIEDSLKQRRSGDPVRFVHDKNMPEPLFKELARKIGIKPSDTVVKGGRYHNFKDFMSFPDLGLSELSYPPMPALPHNRLENAHSIFDVIRKQDVLLNFPYQSFRYVVDFLREASIDPRVRSIKMTIYRIGTNSNVMNALISAARNGKSVTVFMELQARFDEQNNILWSNRLQDEGIRIIQSIPGLKVHAKLILVRRSERDRDVYYTSIGTGNFNEVTASVYGDISLMSADQSLCQEVENVFEMFEASYRPFNFANLVVSPLGSRGFINRMFNRQITAVRSGKKARAVIKLNNIVDQQVAEKIRHAAEEGVSIELIVRGMCVLNPSENLRITSIVGRYLEHARFLYFETDGKEDYYITSADWMKRNLDHRIEVACPIYDKEARFLIKNLMDLQLADNTKARWVNGNKNNQYVSSDNIAVNAQMDFYNFLKEYNQASKQK